MQKKAIKNLIQSQTWGDAWRNSLGASNFSQDLRDSSIDPDNERSLRNVERVSHQLLSTLRHRSTQLEQTVTKLRLSFGSTFGSTCRFWLRNDQSVSKIRDISIKGQYAFHSARDSVEELRLHLSRLFPILFLKPSSQVAAIHTDLIWVTKWWIRHKAHVGRANYAQNCNSSTAGLLRAYL